MINTEAPHRPRYFYCPDPDSCCEHWWPIYIECAVCHQLWPCETKRSHHTAAAIERIARWVNGRIARPPITERSLP